MQAIACLPEERAAALSRVAEQERIEELRLRCGEAPSVRIGGAERPLSLAPVTADELRETVSRAARYSVHSYAESMRQGFLPLEGGHRLGLCGTAVLAAAHAAGLNDLRRRPLYRRLLSLGVFERVLTIEQKDGKRSYRMEKTEGTTC